MQGKMPWVDSNTCTGCGICIEKCPAGAILMGGGIAKIVMANCIRCGVCHDVCAMKAIRHDSELIPATVTANVEMTERYMELCAKHFGDDDKKRECLARMVKHFNKERIVAEKTLERLEGLKKGHKT